LRFQDTLAILEFRLKGINPPTTLLVLRPHNSEKFDKSRHESGPWDGFRFPVNPNIVQRTRKPKQATGISHGLQQWARFLGGDALEHRPEIRKWPGPGELSSNSTLSGEKCPIRQTDCLISLMKCLGMPIQLGLKRLDLRSNRRSIQVHTRVPGIVDDLFPNLLEDCHTVRFTIVDFDAQPVDSSLLEALHDHPRGCLFLADHEDRLSPRQRIRDNVDDRLALTRSWRAMNDQAGAVSSGPDNAFLGEIRICDKMPIVFSRGGDRLFPFQVLRGYKSGCHPIYTVKSSDSVHVRQD
jgi:hypothetical protein